MLVTRYPAAGTCQEIRRTYHQPHHHEKNNSLPKTMASKITTPVAVRLLNPDLKIIDSAIEATPGLSRTKIFRAAIARFIRSDDFLQLSEGKTKTPA